MTQVLDQVHFALRTIGSSTEVATVALESTSFEFLEFCPNGTRGESVMGVDLEALAELSVKEHKNLMVQAETKLAPYNESIVQIKTWADEFHDSVQSSEPYLWAVPGLLLAISIVSTLGALGVVLAWKGRSGKILQNTMSYGILPFLITLSVVCWAGAIGAAIGTSMGGGEWIALR